MVLTPERAAMFHPFVPILSLGLLLICGCVAPNRERAQQFNDDGIHLFRQGNYRDALESFEVARKLAPEDAALHYNLAQCYDRLGDYPKAEKCYHDCLQQSPEHTDCRYALTVLQFRTGRRTEAVQSIEDWLAREPKNSAPYALDGWRLKQEGALPQAQGRLHQALALDPKNERALTELAGLYELMERPDRSMVLYERALAQNPYQPAVLDRLNRLKAKGVSRPLPD
jgi:protein O-GlcNAc transferase